MAKIHLATNGQRLMKVETPKIASGDRNVDYLLVDFCPAWDGFTKTAVFYHREDEVYYAMFGVNNECVIPWEVLQTDGVLYMGVFGVNNDLRKTSEIITYKIDKGAIFDDVSPSDPTPEIYHQIIEKYNDLSRKYSEMTQLYAELTQLYSELTQVSDTTVQTVTAHAEDKNNPHEVSKDHVGLGNVPNVTTDDQTPTYTVASTLADLTTGEKISVAFGKIAKAITDLISHIGNKSNPHAVTAAQAGAVPTSRTVNNKALSDNITLSASDVGARSNTWTPSASDVGAVNKNGDTMTGALTTTRMYVNPGDNGFPTMEFCAGEVRAAFIQQDIRDGKRSIGFYLFQSDQDANANKYYTAYTIPAPLTGQTSNKAYDLLTKRSAKTLWLNSSPQSSFNGQTITIPDMKFCDCVMVVLNASYGNNFIHIAHRNAPETCASTPANTRYDSGTFYETSRAMGIFFDTGKIEFGHGKQNGEQNQNRAVPIAVIGLY